MNTAKKLLSTIGVAAMLGTVSTSASAFKSNVDFSIGGYAKLSAMYTETSDAELGGGAGSTGRTFYVPSATPVSATGATDDGDGVLDFGARESRINIKANTEMDGHKLGMFVEMDFLTTGFGNEVVSNSTSPRLRHYFMTYDNWLFGQTWSTFMDVGALPESVDFLGASEGTVFIRQAQARYSVGALQIALENPETWADTGVTDDNGFPDIAANYKVSGDWGHVRLNGLVRQLKIDNTGGTNDDTVAWGAGISGKLKVGKDDFRFSVHSGDGMGRYVGLAVARDAVENTTTGELDTVEVLAAFVAYRHAWGSKSRSSLIYSIADIDNPVSGAATLFKESSSVAINWMYSPVKPVTFGVMLLTGTLETENGEEGDIDRLQFSAKYAF